MSHAFGLHQGLTILGFLKTLLSGFPHTIGHHVHRGFEIQVLPLARKRPAIFHFFEPSAVGMKFEGIRSFWTEPTSRNRGAGVPFDGDQPVALVKDQLPTTDSTVGANRPGNLRSMILGLEIAATRCHGFRPGTIRARAQLLQNRPARENVAKFHDFPTRTFTFRGKVWNGSSVTRLPHPKAQIVL